MSIILPFDLQEKLQRLAQHKQTTPEALLCEWLQTQHIPEMPQKPRTPNPGKGRMQMSDDFDDYPGDDFWFGDDGNN